MVKGIKEDKPKSKAKSKDIEQKEAIEEKPKKSKIVKPTKTKTIRKIKKEKMSKSTKQQKMKEKSTLTRLRKFEQITEADKENKGIVYLGHIPYGFDEDGIRKYFTQFGTVTRIRLARSKKTGRMKGYGYIEFELGEVAKIAAKTMNNYIMFGHKLVCEYVDPETIHPHTFKGWKKKWVFHNKQKEHAKQYNQERNEEMLAKRVKNLLKSEKERRNKIKADGMEYNYPGFEDIINKYKEMHMKSKNITKEKKKLSTSEIKTKKAAKKEKKGDKAELKNDKKKR